MACFVIPTHHGTNHSEYGAGIFLLYFTGKQTTSIQMFGTFFSLIGIFLLFSLLNRFKKLKSNPTGDELVVINESELKLSKGLGAETYTYSWKQIEKIIVTKLYLDRDLDGEVKHKNCFIVLINRKLLPLDFIDRSKRGLNQNTREEVYYTYPLPKKINLENLYYELNSRLAGK